MNQAAFDSSDFDKWMRTLSVHWNQLPIVVLEMLYVYWSKVVREGQSLDMQFSWRVQDDVASVSPNDPMSKRAAEILPLLERGPITDQEIISLQNALDRKYGFSNPE